MVRSFCADDGLCVDKQEEGGGEREDKGEGWKHTIIQHCRIKLHKRSLEHVRLHTTRVRGHDKDVRVLNREVLEHLGLGELGAAVGRRTRGVRTRGRNGHDVGADAYDRGVGVVGREEGARRDHCAFDVRLRCLFFRRGFGKAVEGKRNAVMVRWATTD